MPLVLCQDCARICNDRHLAVLDPHNLPLRPHTALYRPLTPQKPRITMNQTPILIAAALAVGIGGGYIIGNNTSGGDAENNPQSSARALGPRMSGDGSGSRTGSRPAAKRYSGFQEINRLPGTSNRVQALVQYYQSLSPQQLEDEANKLEELPMGERIMASMLLFSRWGEVDPYTAFDYANGLGWAGMLVRPTVLQSWASVDPASAGKYMTENPREFAMMGMGGGRRGGPFSGGSAQSVIAGEWAKQDPDGAIAWANGLERGKDGALASVIGEVAREDPAKAASLLGSIDPEAAGGSYRAIAESYGAKDFDAAQAWIATLPADQQAAAKASAISGLARTDPMAAAAQVATMEAGDSKDRAVNDVMGAMAQNEPAKAAEFLAQNGSEEAQRDGMRELIPAWVNQDPAAALNYSMSMEEGSTRDRALSSYIWSNNEAAPADLVKVAENISDERSRSRSIGWMSARWMREDEDAARAYIESSESISDDMKERIMSGGGRGR